MLPGGVNVVRPERATDATFLPVRTEHEVLDDQLTAAGEQFAEGFLSVRPIENVRLLDSHPRQFAALPGKFIGSSRARVCFFSSISSALRALSHSSRETMRCVFIYWIFPELISRAIRSSRKGWLFRAHCSINLGSVQLYDEQAATFRTEPTLRFGSRRLSLVLLGRLRYRINSES
jgi:hypothetical protein